MPLDSSDCSSDSSDGRDGSQQQRHARDSRSAGRTGANSSRHARRRDGSRGADSQRRHLSASQQEQQEQQQQQRRGRESSSSRSSRDERALRTTRLLSLEVGSLKAELQRERQKRCSAVERAEAAEAAHQSAQERVAELHFGLSRVTAQAEGLKAEAAAKGRQVSQLRSSLAATDADMATRVARGQLQVQQLKDASVQLRSLLAACCSFNTSTLHMHCRSTCCQPAGQLLQQLQTALGRLQETLEGKAAPAHAPPLLQDQDHQQHAAAFGPLLSAQLRPASPPAAPSAPASAVGSPCNPGRHSSSWEQQPAPGSLQQLADKASVEAVRLQRSQDAERAALQQQLAAAHAEAAGLRAALGRRQAGEGQHDVADTLNRLAGRLSLAQQQQREAQLTGVAAGVPLSSSLLQGSVSIGSRLEPQSKLGATASRPGSAAAAGLGGSASRFGAPVVRPLSSGGLGGVSRSFSRSPSPGRYVSLSHPGAGGGSPASPAARASALRAHTTATIAASGGDASSPVRRRCAPAAGSIGAQRPPSAGSPTAHVADVAAHCKALVAEADAALHQLAGLRSSSAGALRRSVEAGAPGSPLQRASFLLAGKSSPSKATMAAGLRALDRDIAQAEASLSAAAARLSQQGGGSVRG